MIVKQSKAQIMILDALIFIIIILLVIIIQTNIIINYQNNNNYLEQKTNFLKNDYLIDTYILDCDFLGYFNTHTQKCTPNVIEIKNINKLPSDFCKISIDNKQILNKNKKIIETHTRGVVYNSTFSILEVAFCET